MAQQMTVSNEKLKDLIIEATNRLLAVCDGAHTKDYSGFNGGHSMRVRKLLSKTIIMDEDISELQEILNTYKNTQLPYMLSEQDQEILFGQKYVVERIIDDSTKNFKIPFGKHKNQSYAHVAKTDPDYLQWMASQAQFKESSTYARQTLEGKPLHYDGPKPEPTKIEKKVFSVTFKDNMFQLKFPYSSKLLAAIKNNPPQDRVWDKEKYLWNVSAAAIQIVLNKVPTLEPEYELSISEEAKQQIEKINERISISTAASTNDDFIIPGINGELMPFQKVGVQFVNLANGQALIADQMGLGKTIQALGYLQLTKPERALIIVPASLKINWERETNKWVTYTSSIIRIKNAKQLEKVSLSEYAIVIINYDLIKKLKVQLIDYKAEIVVFDESHYLKNIKAQRTQAAKEIVRSIPKRLLLTGTPVLNRPNELYSQLSLIDDKTYPEKGFFKYALRYCNAHEISIGRKGTAWDFSGASNIPELHNRLKNIMIRRTKDQVLTELPPKQKQTIFIDATSQELKSLNREYEEYKKSENKEDFGKGYILTLIERMKQASVRAKLEKSIDWIKDFIENDEKIVLFTTHNETVDQLMNAFSGQAVKLTGSSSQNERQLAIDKFQNDPSIKVFVGNLKAAGVGITLTAASSVAFIELGWTPGEHLQAEDRCHRIGQKDTVNIYYLLIEDSIEYKIASMLLAKSKIIDQLTDGNMEQSLNLLNHSIMGELLEQE